MRSPQAPSTSRTALRRATLALAAAAVLLLVAAACSKDSDDASEPAPDATTAPDADSGDSADGSDSGSPDDAVSVTPDDVAKQPDVDPDASTNSGEPAPDPARRKLAQLNSVEILQMESWPVQVVVLASGDLPNPCHTVWWEERPEGGTRVVDIYAVAPSDPDAVCAAVLEPFEVNIPLGQFEAGEHKVIVNGEAHRFTI